MTEGAVLKNAQKTKSQKGEGRKEATHRQEFKDAIKPRIISGYMFAVQRM